MLDIKNVKFVECENSIALNIASEYKYCKVALFKQHSSDKAQLNKLLIEQGITPIDVYVNNCKSLSVDLACNYVKLPEDVRLIVCTHSSLIFICKYIAKALKIKSLIVCDEYALSLFSNSLAVRCGGEITAVSVSENFFVYVIRDCIDFNIAVTLLAHSVFRLLDCIFSKVVLGNNINIDLYSFAKRNLISGTMSLEQNDIASMLKHIVYADYILSQIQPLSTLDVVGSLCDKVIEKSSVLPICKHAFDSVINCLVKKKDIDMPDFRQRVDELTVLFGLDRAFALKSVYSQINSLNVQTIDCIKEEIITLDNLFNGLNKLYKSRYAKTTPIDFQTERAVLLSGDTPLLTNSMSVLRQCF